MDLDRLKVHRRTLGVLPGQLQGVFDQLLHAVHFTDQAITQTLQVGFTIAGHPQPAQRRAHFVGQVAQQLLLHSHRALQPLGHLVKGTRQFAQFVMPGDGARVQAGRQLIGPPGIGLLAKLVQRHDQHAVQAYTQQQGEQPRDDAVGDNAPQQAVLARIEALRQFDHQHALLRRPRERYAHPRLVDTAPTHRPIDTAQACQTLHDLWVEGGAVERAQVDVEHADPAPFALMHGRHPLVQP